MSKRLQVVLSEDEWESFASVARREGHTLSAWVRESLRAARDLQPCGDASAKLDAIRAAAEHAFPTGDVATMEREIGEGYLA
jgi:hypothetical protein